MNKKIIFIEILLMTVFIGLIFRWINVNAGTGKYYIAIIIDDFGNNSKGTEEMLNLPIKFTGAVMPFMQCSSEEADRLRAKGKEVILHQPMEAHTGQRSWLGPVPILGDMSVEAAVKTFNENAASINAKGFNNHMGSLITEDKAKMTAILQAAKAKNMFFADSVTSAKSIAAKTAEELGVPYVKRDVFLDSTQDIATIKSNIKRTAEIAKKKGYAVAIGHVGAEGGVCTARAISDLYKELENEGVEFVTVSELIKLNLK